MGGNVFASKVPISRLSNANYNLLKTKLAATLQTFYEQVAVAPEAPEKPDHGDVDFLVQSALPQSSHESFQDALQAALAAIDRSANGHTTYFLVPFLDAHTSTPLHAQVDVHDCPPPTLPWMVFRNSYAIAWSILGSILRPYGLTPNDTGLHLRLAHPPHVQGRKEALLFLSDQPGPILSFLAMSPATWAQGFSSVAALYAFLATCRLLSPAAPPDVAAPASDKKRQLKRPLFARFFDDYLPTIPAGVPKDELPDRAAVAEQAAAFFGRESEYAELVARITADAHEQLAARLIVELVERVAPEAGQGTPNLVVRAVKRWIVWREGEWVVREEAEMEAERQLALGGFLDSEGELNEGFRAWLEENWGDLKIRERTRVKAIRAAKVGVGSGGSSVVGNEDGCGRDEEVQGSG